MLLVVNEMKEEKLNLLEDIYLAFFKTDDLNSKYDFILKLLMGLDLQYFITGKIKIEYKSLKKEVRVKSESKSLNDAREKYLNLLDKEFKYLKSLVTKYVNYFTKNGEKVIYFDDINLEDLLKKFQVQDSELANHIKSLPIENTDIILLLLQKLEDNYKK